MSVANLTTIIELTITHGRDGTVWNIINDNQSYGYFERLFLEEGILNVIPSGTLVLRDEGDLISDFNFTGKDKFYLKIKDSDNNELILDDYYVYQVSRATDYQKKGDPRFVTIKFIHESYFFNERSVFDFDEDIKPICKQGTVDSWVGTIFQQYFSKDYNAGRAYASNTGNYAWLKHKNLAFPNGRRADQTKILNLLNYLAENANAANTDGIPRADFFFWKDFSGVNFLSIGDELNANPQPEAKYGVFDRDSITNDNVVKIDDISVFNFSFMELERSGAFQSYYERVDPNLDQPHFYLMDSTNSLKTKIINYNVLDYYSNFGFVDKAPGEPTKKGEEGPPGTEWIPDPNVADYEIINFGEPEIDISSLGKATPTKYTKRVYDEEKFGYFDYGFNNSFYSEPSYFYNTDAGITKTDSTSNRRTSMLWQNMFDIDEESPLDADDDTKNIGKLYITLKKNKSTLASVYFKLRNLKEQWNIFKYVICCLRQESIFDFWAIVRPKSIDPAKTGINTYSFQEVYFIPKFGISQITSKVDFFKGVTLEAKGLTSLGSPLNAVPTSGFTFMVPIQNIGTNQTAFNINEIRNFTAEIAGINYAYAGPGTNMNVTGYPDEFKNIPIGSNLGINTATSNNIANLYDVGQIVKMTAIDWKSIRGVSVDETWYQNNKYLFVFDSQNDKEGFCDGSNITING
jgi:hypothetical protein